MVASAVRRNVHIAIYIDDQLNRDSAGAFKRGAEEGIASLVGAGAKVTIVKGVHNKTLARDNNLIAEGSFNWLSAVRTAGGIHQREERTMIVEGDEVASMIEKELMGLVSHGGLVQNVHPEEVKTWNASAGHWVFACTLLAASAMLMAFYTFAGIAAFCAVFRYMFFLSKPQSYTVQKPGISEPTLVEEDSAFSHDSTARIYGSGSGLNDDGFVKAATTAGYIGVYGPIE